MAVIAVIRAERWEVSVVVALRPTHAAIAAPGRKRVVLAAAVATALVAAPAMTKRPSGSLSGREGHHADAHQGDGKKLFHGILFRV